MVIRDLPVAPEPPANASTAKGYRFGRYRLIRPLGMGGMAQVWLAIKVIFGGEKVVALKMPADLLGLAESDQIALLNEIRIASQFSHSNIVQVFDAGVHRGVVYMELERVDGIDLEQLLEVMRQRGAPLSVDVAVYIWRCVLEALHYAYTYEREGKPHSVIHRDLNPANVLVSSSGEVKVMDFGIAKVQSHETSGNHIKGKPRYMPPEQISGRSTTRVDLFGAAAMFWEMVEGKRFRHDVPTAELIACALSGRVPAITSARVDDDLKEIYARCTNPDPEKRLANPGEVLAMLRRWQGRAADPATLRELYAWQLQTRRHSGYTDGDMPVLPERMFRLLEMLRQIDKEEEVDGAPPAAGAPGSPTGSPAVPPAPQGRPLDTPAVPLPAEVDDGAPSFFRRSRGSSGLDPLGARGVRDSVLEPTEDGPIPGQTHRLGGGPATTATAAARTEVLPGGGMPMPPGEVARAAEPPRAAGEATRGSAEVVAQAAERETTRDAVRGSTEPTVMTVVHGRGRMRIVVGAIAAMMSVVLLGLVYMLVPDAKAPAAVDGSEAVARGGAKGTQAQGKEDAKVAAIAKGTEVAAAAVEEVGVLGTDELQAQASGPKLLPVPQAEVPTAEGAGATAVPGPTAALGPAAVPGPLPSVAETPTAPAAEPAVPEPAVPEPAVPEPAVPEPAVPEPEPTPEPAAAPKAAPSKPKVKPKPVVLVDVRLAPNFAEGEVRIGKKVWVITKTIDVKLPEGTHKLAWHSKAGEPWRTVDPLRLAADRKYMVRVGATTLKVTSIPAGSAP
jgi:hypothetical protein